MVPPVLCSHSVFSLHSTQDHSPPPFFKNKTLLMTSFILIFIFNYGRKSSSRFLRSWETTSLSSVCRREVLGLVLSPSSLWQHHHSLPSAWAANPTPANTHTCWAVAVHPWSQNGSKGGTKDVTLSQFETSFLTTVYSQCKGVYLCWEKEQLSQMCCNV